MLGARAVTVLDAPGHTPDSLALLVDGQLFTGDALFAGGAGRTDFIGGSASNLFDTFRRFDALPDATVVHPGHDYTGRAVTTIGEEKTHNPLFREHDRQAFIARMSVKAAPPPGMVAIVRHNLGEAEAATVAPLELQALRARTPSPFILDVRSVLEFEGERIEGARNISVDQLESRLGELPEHEELFVVCRTGIRATIAAASLARAGRRARVLEGGMLAWRRAHLPVREGIKRLAVDRQVQLIAGTMVLAGVGLGAFVNPLVSGPRRVLRRRTHLRRRHRDLRAGARADEDALEPPVERSRRGNSRGVRGWWRRECSLPSLDGSAAMRTARGRVHRIRESSSAGGLPVPDGLQMTLALIVTLPSSLRSKRR